MTDLKEIVLHIENCARETGKFILKEAEGFDIGMKESKGLNNFVSYVDKGAEKLLVSKLSELLPESGFLTEEGTSTKKGVKYCWVIDPLDGTTNFLHGVPPFAISIALMEYEVVIAGVVYVVSSDEMFSAWRDGGAWLNGQPIKVSNASSVADSLVATGFPYSDFSRMEEYMNCLSHLWKNSHGIRRLGSAATDLAYVACGRFEIFYEYGLHPWDIAAGIILIREAGGKISDFSGNEKNLNGEDIVGSNALVYEEILEIVSNFMNK